MNWFYSAPCTLTPFLLYSRTRRVHFHDHLFFLPNETTSNLVPLVHTLVPSQTLCRTKLQMCVYRLSKSLIWILYDKNTFPLPSSWIMKMPPHMPYILLVAFAHLKKLKSNWIVRNLPGSLGYTSIMPANASQYQLPCDLPRTTVPG